MPRTKCKVAVACPQCMGVRRIDAQSAKRIAREGGGRCRACMGKACRKPRTPTPKVLVACPRCKQSRAVHKNTAAGIAASAQPVHCRACAHILHRAPPDPHSKYPGCRHCDGGYVNRPRGLCWTCYYIPGVRELYPSTSKYARRGLGNLTSGNGLPLPEPTDAVPGTPEKVAVLEARAAAGHALWHPGDAQADTRPADWTPPVITRPHFGGGCRRQGIFDTDALGAVA